MPFYLLLLLGWFGAAFVVALALGRFIAAGTGDLHANDDFVAPTARREREDAVARPGKREAA